MYNVFVKKTALALAVSMAFGLGSAVVAEEVADQPTAAEVVKNEKGESLYTFNLNDAALATSVSKKSLAVEPKRKKISELDENDDFRSWQSPEMRVAVRAIEREYGITAVAMTSWTGKSFSAYVNVEVLERLKHDSRVASVDTVSKGTTEFSAWADTTEGGEIVPWGKKAVGANDSRTSSLPIYVLDSGVLPHSELNYTELPINLGVKVLGYQHATHVAGIIGAKQDNIGVRGINPGEPIISVNLGSNPAQTQMAMDMIFRDSEDKGLFGILNISSNGAVTVTGPGNPPVDGYTPDGVYGKRIRKLSNRLLVVQSAGNVEMDRIQRDACEVSYYANRGNTAAPQSPVDGVLVVSGIDENGAMAVGNNNNHVGFGYNRVNDGKCVEIWAPGARVWSTWENNTVQYLSGTSMAAPHISALAARYGDTTTRPPEREAYIRSRTLATGYKDTKNNPIRIHSYMAPVQITVPFRLKPVAVSTSGGTGDPTTAYDGKYLSGNFWNAGAQTGFIQFDLGSSRQIKSLRMTPAKSMTPGASLMTMHEVYVGNNPASLSKVADISDSGAEDLSPISSQFSATGRYVKIVTTSSPASWLSWREIEIYGN